MRKLKMFICLVVFMAGMVVHANPVGQVANYVLNKSSERTSPIIEAGQGKAVVKEYQPGVFFGGGAYLVSLEYTMDIPLFGPEYGSVEFLVPEIVFTAPFLESLDSGHPLDFETFKLGFVGMTEALDHQGKHYDTCYLTRAYDIDLGLLDYYDTYLDRRVVLAPENVSGIFVEIENLEVKLTVNQAVPVVGAVQIDISGTMSGMKLKAGFDYTAN